MSRDSNRVLVRFNSLISQLARSGQFADAVHLYSRVHSSPDLTPDQYSLSSALSAASLSVGGGGQQLHSYAVKSGLSSFSHVANSVLSFYARSRCPDLALQLFVEFPAPDSYSYTTLLSAFTKVGRVGCALKLFAGMPKKDVALWNAVVTGCVENGCQDMALRLFVEMRGGGVGQDQYTYASVLSICDLPEMLPLGRQVHCMVIKSGFDLIRVSVVSAMITMYFNCEVIGDACLVFQTAEIRDCITYNAFITGLVDCGNDSEAKLIFKEMLCETKFRPNQITFLSILSGNLSENFGSLVHALAVKIGLDNSTLVGNALVTMYSSFGYLNSACLIFENISDKDTVSWNSIIAGYSQQDCSERAIRFYSRMQRDGIKPDEFTLGSLVASARISEHVATFLAVAEKNGLGGSREICNAAISAFSKLGGMKNAYKIFNEMSSRNLVSWNSILSGCVLNGQAVEGLGLFSDLVIFGVKPNSCTLSIILGACATLSALGQGKQLHSYILRSGCYSETLLQNSLVSMYAKCGVLGLSERVFNSMATRDLVSWNSMIAAYAQHGDGEETISCFREMQNSGVKPDKVTFTIVLSACGHSGLVEEGRKIFSSLINDYGMEPESEHCSCIVDLLGRAGHLDEVEKLIAISKTPGRIDCSVWWALLSACSVHGNTSLGRIAADFLLETEPNNPAVYVLLSNINSAAGRWAEACDVREQMKRSGVTKKPGYSWIQAADR